MLDSEDDGITFIRDFGSYLPVDMAQRYNKPERSYMKSTSKSNYNFVTNYSLPQKDPFNTIIAT